MRYLIFISTIVFLISCKKETSVVIQAQDYITGDGSAYAGQKYAVAETWTPFQETKSKIVSEGFLDENGKASFVLKMKNNRRYILGVSQPDNICYGDLAQYYLDHEENNTVSFEYAECAYLKLKIQNINCAGPGDNFKLYHEGSDVGYLELGDNPIKEGDGCYLFEPSYFSEIPVGRRFYKWEVTRSGTTDTYYDTINLEENEQRVYEILY